MLLVSAMQKTGRSVLHKVSEDKIAKRSAWITSNNNSASGFLTTIDSNSSSSAFQPRFSTVTETKNITTTTQDKTATRYGRSLNDVDDRLFTTPSEQVG
ncbi:hypothetical protein Tcan_09157 [Toxocara canis]|uniref:Uncharacterized protein n=1 Tax=Toxocara canis TaxID=6265 RepID=A0A0B2UUA3_TOXCA|nr:hypothetical protein Tcan_09157 [Toxocara canis]